MPRYNSTANGLASLGRNGDTMLMHVNPQEVAGLSALLGSEPTINPDTGMPEAFSWLSPIMGLFGSVAEMGIGANIADELAGSEFAKGLSEYIDPETLGTIGASLGGGLAGAGIGAATAGMTGQNVGYGAFGGAGSGLLSGADGGMEKESLLGAPPITEAETKADDMLFSEKGGPALKRSITPEERPGFFKTNFGSMAGMKNFAKEHGSVPVMAMGVNMGLAGTDEDRERIRQQQEFRRGQERQSMRNAALYESYMQPYRFAGGGAVVTREPDAFVGQAAEYGVPITVRFPDEYVDQTKKAGGIESLLQQELRMAQGGYINTKPFDPNAAHPLSMVDKAKPYAATAPQRHEVIDGYADGGFIDGEGDGMSDDIDANIDGIEPVKVADGEFIIPKDIVDMLGVDALDDMMKHVRMAAHGSDKQIKQDAAKKAFMQTVMG